MKILDIRAIQGANYFSLRPVIVMRLDLEEYDEVFTSGFPGFAERLLSIIPSIQEHKCSKGVPGGLIERIREGTLLGHVIEHIAIELQYITYMEVGFGKTRWSGEPRVYNIVYSYWVEKAGIFAGKEAYNIVTAILNNEPYDIDSCLNALMTLLNENRLVPSTASIVDEAEKRHITVIRLDGYNVIQLGEGKFQKRLMGTITSNTSFIGVETADDKILSNRILKDAGVPVPIQYNGTTIEEIFLGCKTLGFPVVIKPAEGSHGRGVTVGVGSEDELQSAFAYALPVCSRIIIEQMIQGNDYRILVVNGSFVAAVRRIPAHVIGDGDHSITELIEIENKNPERGFGHEKPMTRLSVTSATESLLRRFGYSLDTILGKGERFDLELRSNLSTGGTAKDVTDTVHPVNRRIAERVSKIVGLDVAGVDIIAPTLDDPIIDNGGVVLEINASPALRSHISPSIGSPRNVSTAIVDMLFPNHIQHDIPIIAIAGTLGKSTTARLLSSIMKSAGYAVGLACSDGMYIKEKKMNYGDQGNHGSAKIVLQDPTIDCAIFEVGRNDLYDYGLGYKCADAGIVLNVIDGPSHYKTLDNLEDISYLQSIIAEAVRPGGYSILNADDQYCVDMKRRCYEHIVYFSTQSNNPLILNHIAREGTAVFIQNNHLTVAENGTFATIAEVSEIPLLYNGAAPMNKVNALAAIAASFSLGVSIPTISASLKSFFPSMNQNPGRLNMITGNDFTILIDSGKYAAAHTELSDFVRRMEYSKTILLLSTSSDQSPEDVIKSGKILSSLADETLLFDESPDTTVHDTISLHTVLKAFQSEDSGYSVRSMRSFSEALDIARKKVRSEDLVLIIMRNLETITKFVGLDGIYIP